VGDHRGHPARRRRVPDERVSNVIRILALWNGSPRRRFRGRVERISSGPDSVPEACSFQVRWGERLGRRVGRFAGLRVGRSRRLVDRCRHAVYGPAVVGTFR
jgi:hypothetical protein